MNFDDRKKAIEKHRKLAQKSLQQINEHPFVISKKKLITKHQDAVRELLDGCTHDEVSTKSTYFEGSYYDKAETSYWDECSLCGKTLNKRIETHSWYG